jgi:catechol 2,3-dioxygenase-like lactoylglutathione lyase family enzyme
MSLLRLGYSILKYRFALVVCTGIALANYNSYALENPSEPDLGSSELLTIDHILIETSDLEKSVSFYENIIGLKCGPRPSFKGKGAWLYAGLSPVIHLNEQISQLGSLGPKKPGPVQHVALRSTHFKKTLDRLKQLGVSAQVVQIDGMDRWQINLVDPNGLTIELSFLEHDGPSN